ncbi:hypothetical protein [Dactylosporangium sp. CA-092794]|uniref:hypothetical protein n=1 Tax=Dactylosporangium sp. CA-092794 TaxID=3239929 RepID=UPI003D932BBE
MSMPEPAAWDSIVDLAYTLADAGEDADAAALAAGLLSPLDPATTGPDERVIAAAVLYAHMVDPVPGLVPDGIAWARYARRAAHAVHGAGDEVAVAATEVLARLLYIRGEVSEADQLRRELVQLHLDRGDIDAHLLARMGLAQQQHAAGRCGDAVRDAMAVWQQWIVYHEPTDRCSLPVALPLNAMLLACGRFAEAATIAAAVGLQPPEPGDAGYDVYRLLAATLALSVRHHQQVCARRLDQAIVQPAGEGVAATPYPDARGGR